MATFYLATRNIQAEKKRGGAHADYIAGAGRYENKYEVVFCKDYNLPNFAKNGRDFFAAADKYERSNGRSFRELVIAIPHESSDPVEWAKKLALEIVENQTMRVAVHKQDGNWHAHIMFSERTNSPTLSPDKYFSRANKKNRVFNSKDFIDKVAKSKYLEAIKSVVPDFERPTRGLYQKIGTKKSARTKEQQEARAEAILKNELIKRLILEDKAITDYFEPKTNPTPPHPSPSSGQSTNPNLLGGLNLSKLGATPQTPSTPSSPKRSRF